MQTDTTSLKIFACSDIHFHHYMNGISLHDVINVGNEFIQLSRLHKVDAIILGGDYSVSRNPMYEVNLAIGNWFKALSMLGIPIITLVGNHDRIYKSNHKIHILEHINLYPKDWPNIHLFDTARSQTFNIKNQKLTIHGIPAGHDIPIFEIDQHAHWNIAIFHGMMIGSYYQNGVIAQEGMPVQTFDSEKFDMIIGGDNHAHQVLPLKHTNGFYIGSPMQHNWGDINSKRGFVLLDLNSDTHQIQYQHIESNSPKFIKTQIHINDINDLLLFMTKDGPQWVNNIIDLQISGPGSTLKHIIPQDWVEKIKEKYNVRSIEIHLEYDLDRIIPIQHQVRSDAEDWEEYLILTDPSQIKKLDPEKLKNLGHRYINNF